MLGECQAMRSGLDKDHDNALCSKNNEHVNAIVGAAKQARQLDFLSTVYGFKLLISTAIESRLEFVQEQDGN